MSSYIFYKQKKLLPQVLFLTLLITFCNGKPYIDTITKVVVYMYYSFEIENNSGATPGNWEYLQIFTCSRDSTSYSKMIQFQQ